MNALKEQRPTSAALPYDRIGAERRKDGMLGSPHFGREPLNSFRSFQPTQHDTRQGVNGHGPPGRPSSQPAQHAAPRGLNGIAPPDVTSDGRFGSFRQYEAPPAPERHAEPSEREPFPPFQNGYASWPAERTLLGSPQIDRDSRIANPLRVQPGAFGTPMREDQAGVFKPAHPLSFQPTRDSIEHRPFQDVQREAMRSPPPPDYAMYQRGRNGFVDRPMTFEEHRRMEAMQREQMRKESEGSVHRAILNLSPEVNRVGRNSPLPQAVQGAQTRHMGPGENRPGIKTEFGRMFSGLGSGVGTATPTAGQSVNGATTPSRVTPLRQLDDGNLVRTAVDQIEDGRKTRSSRTIRRASSPHPHCPPCVPTLPLSPSTHATPVAPLPHPAAGLGLR